MEESVDAFLDRLAGRSPAPAGGASAALQVAQGAALVAMVARYADLPALAEQLDVRRRRALALIEEDAAAYGAVLAAASKERPAALVEASRPQAEVGEIAAAVIDAAATLVDKVGRAVAPDLATGLLAATAGGRVAVLNVHANLRGSRASGATGATELRRTAESVSARLAVADDLVARLSS